MDSFKLHFEHCINALEPFFGGFLLYDMSLVCFVVSLFLKRRKALLHFATVFLCMAVLWHLFGIAARMYIQSRPPVTNLYSSVVFAGVVASLFGGTLYILRRQLPVAAVACASGLLSLLVAMNLPYSGDTMGMMRSQFEFLAHHARNDHHDRLRKCFFCRVFSLISSGGPFLRLRTG